jgi:hypothetical protein
VAQKPRGQLMRPPLTRHFSSYSFIPSRLVASQIAALYQWG